MDISPTTNRTPVQNASAIPPPAVPAGAKNAQRPALVVSDVRTDAAEAVSESELRRDDGLGKLFAAAFTLPAPPMPAFPG